MESLQFENKLKELKKNNIAFIGHMGSGKSIVGKILARSINFQHIDSDSEITRFAGKSINQIFEEGGEEYFRDIETMILLKLIDKKNVILSLGGGSVLNKLVREKLKNNSITVFLNVDLVELERRLKKSTNRPLLKGVDIRMKIKNLDISRRKYYLLSDIIIKNTDTVADTCQNFIKKFTNFNEKSNSHKNK